MLWHILEPVSKGSDLYHSIDYVDDLTDALFTLRRWRWNLQRSDLALAKGRNGEALHYVVFLERKGERKTAISVHRTALGAKRAYLKFGRSLEAAAPEITGWGWETIAMW